MKISIINTSHNTIGGVERAAEYLKHALIAHGCAVTIIAIEDLSLLQRRIIDLSYYVALKPVILGYFLGKRVKQESADVVITSGLLGWSYTGKCINVQQGTYAKSAVRIDLHRNFIKYIVKRFWGLFEGIAGRRANQCLAVSQETKESAELYYRVQNVKVLLNAIDTQFFHPTSVSKKNQIMFVGRFEYAKGKDILEGVKSYVESQGWNFLVAEKLTQDELLVAYNESKVFLFPSLHEGCSFALLDAMACGLPFLASPVGLVPALQQKGLFPECIVVEQTVDAYCKAFEGLKNTDEGLPQRLRDYVVSNHEIKAFGETLYAMIKSL